MPSSASTARGQPSPTRRDDIPPGAVPAAGPRSWPPAGHVLRRRDRRAYRALGDDLGHLGGQGLLAAGRRAGGRARQPNPGRPARSLARHRGARGRVGMRARGGLGGRAGRRRDRARRGWRVGLPRRVGSRCWQRALQPLAGRVRRRRTGRACTTSGSRCGRSPTRTSRGPRPRTTTPRWPARPRPSCGGRPPSVIMLTDGGRLLSEANPASPSGLASLTEPLARSGSLVLVTHASAERRSGSRPTSASPAGSTPAGTL